MNTKDQGYWDGVIVLFIFGCVSVLRILAATSLPPATAWKIAVAAIVGLVVAAWLWWRHV